MVYNEVRALGMRDRYWIGLDWIGYLGRCFGLVWMGWGFRLLVWLVDGLFVSLLTHTYLDTYLFVVFTISSLL